MKPSRKKRKQIAARKRENIPKQMVCGSCGCPIFFNLDLCKDFGMCGACITGEARYNYEEVED